MLETNVAQQNTASTEGENLNKQECLVEQYENTPFLLVQADEGYFLALGNSRLTDVYKDRAKLENFVKNNTWNLIGSFVLSLINNTELIKNEN